MYVANQKLCEELFELSGWGEKHFNQVPAYDLGYLLRNLQDTGVTVLLRCNQDLGGNAGMSAWDGKWCIGTFDMPQGKYPVADTPEDAACKLAIELFKEGILSKGNDLVKPDSEASNGNL